MDVQTDQAGLQADPFATAVVPRPVTGGQGQLFSDGYPTFADTDQIPPVHHGARRSGRPRTSRLLRLAVAIVALAVIAGAAALGLVKAGVIDTTTNGGSPPNPTATPPTHHNVAPPSTSPAVSQVSTGSGTATYTVDFPAYAVNVSTSTGRSWISIGAAGQHPVFSGILGPNSSHRVVLLGPTQVDVGAGGTTVTVTAGRHSTTLTPPSAPFTYQFQPKNG